MEIGFGGSRPPGTIVRPSIVIAGPYLFSLLFLRLLAR
jgi:hypothetical protein